MSDNSITDLMKLQFTMIKLYLIIYVFIHQYQYYYITYLCI